MDTKGMERHHAIVNLEDALGVGAQSIRSVWYLKQFLEVTWEDGQEQDFRRWPSVRVRYGFENCRNSTDFGNLRALYMRVFDWYEVRLLDLDAAAVQGKVLEYIYGFYQLRRYRRQIAQVKHLFD